MSELPPIPLAAHNAVRRAYGEAVDARSFDDIWARVVAAVATILWQEWTRGMAVVPLPEPEEGDFGWFPAGIAVTALNQHGGPQVDMDFGHYGIGWPANVAREVFAAGLAACDRAEQLAAEANTEGATA